MTGTGPPSLGAVRRLEPIVVSAQTAEFTPSNVVTIAGTNLGIRFESDVSDELKKTIVHDIELNTAHFQYFEIREVPAHVTAHGGITHRLDEGSQKRLFPEVFNKYFSGVVYENGKYRLIVRDELIKAYEEAVRFKAAHPVMFDQLDEFMEKLESPEFARNVAKDKDLANSLLYSEYVRTQARDHSEELSQLLSQAVFRTPSILDFYPGSLLGADKGTVAFPLMTLPACREPITKGVMVFIYVDEKWYLCNPLTL